MRSWWRFTERDTPLLTLIHLGLKISLFFQSKLHHNGAINDKIFLGTLKVKIKNDETFHNL